MRASIPEIIQNLITICDSGHPGPKGNVEYFVYFCDAGSPLADRQVDAGQAAARAVEVAHA